MKIRLNYGQVGKKECTISLEQSLNLYLLLSTNASSYCFISVTWLLQMIQEFLSSLHLLVFDPQTSLKHILIANFLIQIPSNDKRNICLNYDFTLPIVLISESLYLSRISISISVKVLKTDRPYPVWIPHPHRVDKNAAPKVKSSHTQISVHDNGSRTDRDPDSKSHCNPFIKSEFHMIAMN